MSWSLDYSCGLLTRLGQRWWDEVSKRCTFSATEVEVLRAREQKCGDEENEHMATRSGDALRQSQSSFASLQHFPSLHWECQIRKVGAGALDLEDKMGVGSGPWKALVSSEELLPAAAIVVVVIVIVGVVCGHCRHCQIETSQYMERIRVSKGHLLLEGDGQLSMRKGSERRGNSPTGVGGQV